MFNYPEDLSELLIRPLVAVVCGAALGLDRELRDKPAGLRTQMLVALGTCIFTLAAIELHDELVEKSEGEFDPLRAIQGIAGGIGFLGAGTIIRSQGSVQGITTAATVWVVGAAGMACGMGFYSIGLITVGYAFLILTVIGFIEHILIRHK